MAVRLDPADEEIAALGRVGATFDGRCVLEIGCGEGRITRRYAVRASSVVAIDPDPTAVHAFGAHARKWPEHLEFLPLSFEVYAMTTMVNLQLRGYVRIGG